MSNCDKKMSYEMDKLIEVIIKFKIRHGIAIGHSWNSNDLARDILEAGFHLTEKPKETNK